MRNALFQKFLKFSYGSWIGLFLGLMTTMITTRILSPDAFGKASMFDLFIQIGMVLTIFGTDQAFIRFYYEEKLEKRGFLLYNCLKIPLFTTILMILIVILFYKPITNFLFGEEELLLALVVCVGIVAQLYFRFGQLVIRMQQKGNLYSLLQIFQRVFYLTFVLIFFYFIGSNFVVLVFSKVFTLVLLMFISLYLGRELWTIRNFKGKDVKHTQLDILKFGYPFVLTIFISWLFEAFDKIALRQWSTFDELGMYSAAMRLVALVMILKTTFSTFWTPVAYEKFKNNPNDKVFFKNISIIVSFVMFLVGIFSILAKDIIVLLLGNEYHNAAMIMPFLVFIPIFYTISETTVIGINFFNKVHWHIFISLTSCVINILGNWLLVPEYGAFGASISTVFSYFVFFTIRTLISKRYYKVNYPLMRIYLQSLVILLYAFITIKYEDIWLNIILGIFSLIILVILFYKDLIRIKSKY